MYEHVWTYFMYDYTYLWIFMYIYTNLYIFMHEKLFTECNVTLSISQCMHNKFHIIKRYPGLSLAQSVIIYPF